jgi:hypothetical protein
MQRFIHLRRTKTVATAVLALVASLVLPVLADSPTERPIDAPNGMHLSVKIIGPVTQAADLQIICVFKHDPAGDKYIEAMKDFNDKLGGLLSSVRDRGEFAGDTGETFMFTPPADSIAAKRVLLIGVGEDKNLSIDTLRLVGRIAAREAVHTNAAHVAFAPALRDQGSTRIDVGDCDAAVAEQFLLAYDTELRLQTQGLAPKASIEDFTIEAGRKFFAGAADKVSASAASAADQIKKRDDTAFVAPSKH